MNIKRMRGRNHRPGGGGNAGGNGGGGGPIRHQSGNTPLNRNHVFDSSGPDVRVRGTSQQLFEKYLQMGRDATSSGDRVMAEGYFQHAEHYFRILNVMNQAAQQGQQSGQAGPQHGGPRRFQNEGEFANQTGNDSPFGQSFVGDGDEIEGGFEQRPEQRPEPHREPRNESRPEPGPELRGEAPTEARPQTPAEAPMAAPAEPRPAPRVRQRREPRVERVVAGTGDQPEAREIPIIAAPPEG